MRWDPTAPEVPHVVDWRCARADHSVRAYEGDMEWEQDDVTGLWHIANPLVFAKELGSNLIVTGGRSLTGRRRWDNSLPLSAMGVGTDSTAEALGQTQLNPSVAGSVVIQAFDAGTNTVGLVTTYVTTFGTSVANFVWRETAMFAGLVNGTAPMFNRLTYGALTKTSAISIAYQIQTTEPASG